MDNFHINVDNHFFINIGHLFTLLICLFYVISFYFSYSFLHNLCDFLYKLFNFAPCLMIVDKCIML